MRRLRAECPWKAGADPPRRWRATCSRRPTRRSRRSTPATPPHLREELGDLLLQVYFHAAIAEEAGEFTIDDVAADIIAKMVRRNPHVFGSSQTDESSRVRAHAGRGQRGLGAPQGAGEAARTSVLDGLPPGTARPAPAPTRSLDRVDARAAEAVVRATERP